MIIVTSKRFDKKFQKLPKKTQSQAKRRILLFVEDKAHPTLRDHLLHGEQRELRSFSITGDIRVIYERISKKEVRFLEIGTHSELYGK